MSKRTILATTSAVVCAIFGAASAGAQEAGAPAETAPSEEIVVVGDRVGLLETTPSSTVFGLGMSLLETPRSATMVSDTTLERYGIEEVDDLISISPGTFTASFYGVKGAVNTRGTLAESYFRGFKRIENRGTYPTPLGATSQVELVRGPPSPLYGAGKVGGLLNIVPRTAQADGGTAYIDEIEGDLEVTVGSYGKFNAAGGMGIPLTFGSVEGGLFGYLEIEDSDSYYRGMHPEHQLLQLSSDFDLTPTLTMSMGLMMYRAEGYVQTPGWNRLTQDLIDNQNYIIGQDTTLVDTNGDGRLQPSEVSGGTLVSYYFGGPPGAPPARFTLDTPGAGTTVKLDPRTIYISDRDFSETDTNTFYFELSKEIGVNTLSFEMFYDDLLNDRFVSYGFPAHYDSSVYEARLHYDFELGNEDSFFHANSTAGVSYRNVNALRMETYNSGYIALDRRDLSVGATPTDIMDDPFSTDGGLGWDIAVDTNTEDTGLFALSNMTFGGLINLLIGGRMDWYDVTTINRGPTCFCGVDNVYVSADADEFSWNGSLSINAPFGLFPYYTYAESNALEVGQAGDLAPNLVANGQWISDSKLEEVGVKFELLDGALVGSLSAYEQNRTRLTQLNSVIATQARGVELETRWLATDNLSFTLAANSQQTIVEGPAADFVYIPASAIGLTGQEAYGGQYAVFNFSQFSFGQPGDYELKTVPQTVVSLYGSYVTDEHEWGQAGVTLGVTSVSETAGKLANPVVLPGYELVNASAFYSIAGFEVALNIDNVFDELYFQPVADVYSDLAVLPGRGREWRLTLKKHF